MKYNKLFFLTALLVLCFTATAAPKFSLDIGARISITNNSGLPVTYSGGFSPNGSACGAGNWSTTPPSNAPKDILYAGGSNNKDINVFVGNTTSSTSCSSYNIVYQYTAPSKQDFCKITLVPGLGLSCQYSKQCNGVMNVNVTPSNTSNYVCSYDIELVPASSN